MPTFIDLTERRRDEDTSAASKDGSESSSPAAPASRNGFKGKARPVPKNYVCKRCKTPGHHITQCPTLRDKKFDSKPPPGYSCHACGTKGDHFIHSCPQKIPKSILKKKQAAMPDQSEGGSPDSNPNPSPLGSTLDLSSAPQEESEASDKSRNRNKKSTGHVRKRPDDVEFVSQSRKRFKPESIGNDNPAALEDSPPLLRSNDLAVRMRPLQTGRLSPWDNERNDGDMGVEPPLFMVDTVGLTSNIPPHHRGSRAQRIAKLETTSFLAELELEIEDEEVHQVLARQPQFSSLNDLLADFDVHPHQKPTDSPSEQTQASGDLDSNHVSNSPSAESCENGHTVSGVDDTTTPTPPPTPPTIEPYVTRKILSAPEYGAYTLALFEHTPNIWIRKNRRNTALDMWATPGRDDRDSKKWVAQTACEDA